MKQEAQSIWQKNQHSCSPPRPSQSAPAQALGEEAAATSASRLSPSLLFGLLVLICLLHGAALQGEGEGSRTEWDCLCVVRLRNVYLKQETRGAEQDLALFPP